MLSGAGAPSVVAGHDGDFYIDTTLYNIHGPKAGGWGGPTSLVGPAGAAGANGASGANGAAGTNGVNAFTATSAAFSP